MFSIVLWQLALLFDGTEIIVPKSPPLPSCREWQFGGQETEVMPCYCLDLIYNIKTCGSVTHSDKSFIELWRKGATKHPVVYLKLNITEVD